VLEPVAFLRRLVGIIPPPRRHLVRYAGVFGPAKRGVFGALAPATAASFLSGGPWRGILEPPPIVPRWGAADFRS
jgi:hypothetical protein